ncbi:DUF2142 domain-containing protein [Alkalisalibacterium limincola]|nr:DUF2142 domain-containing protein [Alkalisalibacterium limincola]
MIGSLRVAHRLARSWLVVVLALLGGAAVYAGSTSSLASLELEVEASANPWLQVFHDRNGAFREQRSSWHALDPDGQRRVLVRFPASEGRWLRFDLSAGGTAARLCPIRLRVDRQSLEFSADYVIRLERQLLSARWDDAGCLVVEAEPGTPDPFVVLEARPDLDWPSRSAARNMRWLQFIGMGLLVLAGWRALVVAMPARAPLRGTMEGGLSRLEAALPWIVLGLVLVAGSQHAWRSPPNYAPDEVAHLSKVSRIVSGHPFSNAEGEKLLPVRDMYGSLGRLLHHKDALDPVEVERLRDAPLACVREDIELPTSATPYFPHVYAPTAATYALGCGLGWSFGNFLDAARALNLLLAALLVFWAVRVAGPARWPIAVVAALPMTIAQFASVSADALTISLSLAAVGGLLGAAAGSRPLRSMFPWLLALALALALAKPGIPWVLGLAVLALPRCREQGLNCWKWLGFLVALPLVVHVAWTVLATGTAESIVRDHAQGNAELLLSQPGVFLGQWWNTFFSPYVLVLVEQAIGRLGWLDIPLPGWAYVLGIWMLVATLALRGEATPHSPGEVLIARAWSLALVLGSLAIIALPLFVYWTSPASPYVEGLQGRYFLPTLALLLAALSLRAPAPHRLLLGLGVLAALVVLNIVAVDQMLEAYYITGRRH